MTFKIAMGADHAGFELKEKIKSELENNGHFIDDFGILVCGSGNGSAMTANKHKGIRAAICWNEMLAKLARSHNDANILCMAGRFIDYELAKEIVDIFLKTKFDGGRHQRRIDKISPTQD